MERARASGVPSWDQKTADTSPRPAQGGRFGAHRKPPRLPLVGYSLTLAASCVRTDVVCGRPLSARLVQLLGAKDGETGIACTAGPRGFIS